MSRKRRNRVDSVSAIILGQEEALDVRVRELIHELQVNSEEITVQNEQLLKAQSELEEARDRYADLYDFAPIGYLSLDVHGAIVEINIAAAALFGRQRRFLLKLPLVAMIVKEHRDRFREFLLQSQAHERKLTVETEVRLKTGRVVRVIGRPLPPDAKDREGFTAILDVTSERQLERDNVAVLDRERAKTAQLESENTLRIITEERVKALLERLVKVQEQERRRLALNLHDQLGQQLTALRLALETLRHARADGDRARRFEHVERIVSQLDRDVDSLAWELRPPALDDVGLQAALAELVRQWSAGHSVGARMHYVPRDDGARLPAEIESTLYRIVQEALNNVAKHAHARHVSVLVEHRPEDLKLIVEDDGRGFNPDNPEIRRNGMGLAGIEERALAVGGALEVESSRGKGTTLFVRIPLSLPSPSETETKDVKID